METYHVPDDKGVDHIWKVYAEEPALRMPPCPACQFELAFVKIISAEYREEKIRYNRPWTLLERIKRKLGLTVIPTVVESVKSEMVQPAKFGWKCPACEWVEPRCEECGRPLGLDVALPPPLCVVCAKKLSEEKTKEHSEEKL
jgi:hypothetical protein